MAKRGNGGKSSILRRTLINVAVLLLALLSLCGPILVTASDPPTAVPTETPTTAEPTETPTAQPSAPTVIPTAQPTARCAPGSFYSSLSSACKLCVAGTYCPGNDASTPCEKGYSSLINATACFPCPKDTYTLNYRGNAQCTAVPEGIV